MSKTRNLMDQVIAKAGQDSSQVSADQRRTGHYLAGRSTLLSDLAEGTLKHQEQRLIDPALCRPWQGNARAVGLLTADSCADLIEAIRSEGRQHVPALVRPLASDEGHQYEIIAGLRRHFAISWLRANNYPEFRFLIEVRSVSDEEAFRLSDAENRGRKDISEYERARAYLTALDAHYNGSQKQMAERLRVSDATMSRLLALARLPAPIVAAAHDPLSLTSGAIRPLLPLLNSPPRLAEILYRADTLAAEQRRRVAAGLAVLPISQVVRQLIMKEKRRAAVQDYRTNSGVVVARLKRGRGGAAHIEVSGDQSVSKDQRRTALQALLDDLLEMPLPSVKKRRSY